MSWTQTAVLFGALAFFNLLACLPVLFSSSVRRLFDLLPFENIFFNYVLGMGCFTVLHSVLLVSVTVVTGGLEGTVALWGLGGVTIGTGLIAWLTASFIFPEMEWWNPAKNEDELDGRIALGLGLVWYTFSTGLGMFFLMVVLIAFFFPG